MGHTSAEQEKAHCSTFHRFFQDKRYNLNPVMVCGINVDKMIQAKFVSPHVCFHFVYEADAPPRTCKDVLDTGILPVPWNPSEMLGKINDGQTIFKCNPMVVLTPLGHDGMPIEVPQSVHMVAFVDFKVFVTTPNATCYFASNGHVVTYSAIPIGSISMITNQAGQVLHDTPNIRLLWRVSKND